MKEKNKDTAKGEGEGAEGGLVDLGLDDENAEKKFKQIIYEEEKCIKDFLETMNKQIRWHFIIRDQRMPSIKQKEI